MPGQSPAKATRAPRGGTASALARAAGPRAEQTAVGGPGARPARGRRGRGARAGGAGACRVRHERCGRRGRAGGL
jgi:hypothetical protein